MDYKNLVGAHKMKYYSAVRRARILTYGTTWKHLRALGEVKYVRQRKVKYCTCFHK